MSAPQADHVNVRPKQRGGRKIRKGKKFCEDRWTASSHAAFGAPGTSPYETHPVIHPGAYDRPRMGSAPGARRPPLHPSQSYGYTPWPAQAPYHHVGPAPGPAPVVSWAHRPPTFLPPPGPPPSWDHPPPAHRNPAPYNAWWGSPPLPRAQGPSSGSASHEMAHWKPPAPVAHTTEAEKVSGCKHEDRKLSPERRSRSRERRSRSRTRSPNGSCILIGESSEDDRSSCSGSSSRSSRQWSELDDERRERRYPSSEDIRLASAMVKISLNDSFTAAATTAVAAVADAASSALGTRMEADAFGSVIQGSHLVGSDIDVRLEPHGGTGRDAQDPGRARRVHMLRLLENSLINQSGPLAVCEARLGEGIRVPMIRLQHSSQDADSVGNLFIDVSVGGLSASTLPVNCYIDRLIRRLLEADPIALALVRIVKFWARKNELCSAYEGWLSSVCWTLMVLAHRAASGSPPPAALLAKAALDSPTHTGELPAHLPAEQLKSTYLHKLLESFFASTATLDVGVGISLVEGGLVQPPNDIVASNTPVWIDDPGAELHGPRRENVARSLTLRRWNETRAACHEAVSSLHASTNLSSWMDSLGDSSTRSSPQDSTEMSSAQSRPDSWNWNKLDLRSAAARQASSNSCYQEDPLSLRAASGHTCASNIGVVDASDSAEAGVRVAACVEGLDVIAEEDASLLRADSSQLERAKDSAEGRHLASTHEALKASDDDIACSVDPYACAVDPYEDAARLEPAGAPDAGTREPLCKPAAKKKLKKVIVRKKRKVL